MTTNTTEGATLIAQLEKLAALATDRAHLIMADARQSARHNSQLPTPWSDPVALRVRIESHLMDMVRDALRGCNQLPGMRKRGMR